MGGYGGYGMGGMWLFWLLIIGIIVYGVYRFTVKPKGTGNADPLEILKGRYARGEIDRETFERMKKDLGA